MASLKSCSSNRSNSKATPTVALFIDGGCTRIQQPQEFQNTTGFLGHRPTQERYRNRREVGSPKQHIQHERPTLEFVSSHFYCDVAMNVGCFPVGQQPNPAHEVVLEFTGDCDVNIIRG